MKKNRINDFLILLYLLLQVQFFKIVPFEFFYVLNYNQQQILMLGVVIIYFTYNKFTPFRIKRNRAIILLFVFWVLFEFLWSNYTYKQGLLNAFVAGNSYLLCLSYFMFAHYIQLYKYEKVFNYSVIIASINTFICWVQYLFYGKINIMYNIGDDMRFGSIRISAISGSLSILVVIYLFYKFISSSKTNFFEKITFVFTVLGILIVGKGRAVIIALFISIIIMTIHKNYKDSIKMYLVFITIFIFGIGFINSSLGETYLSSVNIGTSTDTLSIRGKEMTYYNDQTIEHPIVGMGFIRDIPDNNNILLKGYTGQWSRSDIGFLGFANTFGVIAAIVLFLFLMYQLKIILAIKAPISNFLIGYSIYILILFITISLVGPWNLSINTLFLALISNTVGKYK